MIIVKFLNFIMLRVIEIYYTFINYIRNVLRNKSTDIYDIL